MITFAIKKKLIKKKELKKIKKRNFKRFPLKRLKKKYPQNGTNLINILKKGLRKKKRKTRLAGKNYYVLSFKKLQAFQRQASFFMLRYASNVPFKNKLNKNVLIRVLRNIKYRNTILKRPLIKKLLRIRFFTRSRLRGSKTSLGYKLIRKANKGRLLLNTMRKMLLTLRFLAHNRQQVEVFKQKNYFSGFYFSYHYKRVFKLLRKLVNRMRRFKRRFRRKQNFYKFRKYKIRKISRYNILVKKSYNNFFLTAFSKFEGDVFAKITGAASNLKGAKRSTTTSLERISAIFVKDLILCKILKKKFDFVIKTPFVSRGVKNSIRTLVNYKKRIFVRSKRKAFFRKLKIRNIILNYNVSHNGVRHPKQRRV